MRVSPMSPNAVPHKCGILLVLRHLASVSWMYYIIINIHNIHLIHNESMALMLFMTPNNNCTLMNNFLATYFMQWAWVYKTLKMNYENKYRGKTPMEGVVTFTMFPTRISTSFSASLLGRSSSCIELQQNAIERVFLWSTFNHNTQELWTNSLITISKNYFFFTTLPNINNLYDFHTWAGHSSLLSFCLYTSNSLTFSISPTLRTSTQF